MERAQDYLKRTDVNALIAFFLYKYDIPLSDISDDDVTVGDVKMAMKQALRVYVKHLCSLDIKPSDNDKDYIFFTYNKNRQISEPIDSLICLQELHEKGVEAPLYSYHYIPQEEIMGYYISDTRTTQNNITELLVDIMRGRLFLVFMMKR